MLLTQRARGVETMRKNLIDNGFNQKEVSECCLVTRSSIMSRGHHVTNQRPHNQPIRGMERWGQVVRGLWPVMARHYSDTRQLMVIINCHWSRQVMWPEYWPVIGHQADHVTRGNNQSGINWDQSDRNWAQVMPSLLTWKHKSHVTLTTHWAGAQFGWTAGHPVH